MSIPVSPEAQRLPELPERDPGGLTGAVGKGQSEALGTGRA